jgi:hypothetical protein
MKAAEQADASEPPSRASLWMRQVHWRLDSLTHVTAFPQDSRSARDNPLG